MINFVCCVISYKNKNIYYVVSPIVMTSLTQMLTPSDFFRINLCTKPWYTPVISTFQGKSIRNSEVTEGEANQARY